MEVKLDIFQMDGNKAPGPDGLIPLLFQKYREILQVPLWRFVQDDFDKGQFPAKLNHTLMHLFKNWIYQS